MCGIKVICLFRFEARTRCEFHEIMAPLVANPLTRLVAALTTLKSSAGQTTILGFYDEVLPLTAGDLEVWADLRGTGRELPAANGQTAFVGRKGPLDALRAWILEPSINLEGMTGGYVAPQDKAAVPNFAAAEVRFGLVPNQTPERVFRLVLDHIATVGFGDVEVQMVSRNPWARCPVDSGSVQPLVRAMVPPSAADWRSSTRSPVPARRGSFRRCSPEWRMPTPVLALRRTTSTRPTSTSSSPTN